MAIELVDPHVFRACADPQPAVFQPPEQRASRTRSPSFSRTSSANRFAYAFYPGSDRLHPQHAERASLRRRPRHRARRRRRSAHQPLLSDQLRARFARGFGHGGRRFAERSASEAAKRIGVIAGTPPVTFLAADGLLGQIKSYALVVDTRFNSRDQEMMDDLDKGEHRRRAALGPDGRLSRLEVQRADGRHPVAQGKERPSDGLPDRHGRASFRSELEAHAEQADRQQSGRNRRDTESYGVPLLDENDQPITR